MEIDFEEVTFEKEPMPAWLVAKLSKLRDEGRGKLALGMALASGPGYNCGLCKGQALDAGLAFIMPERVNPDTDIVCGNCAEFLDPALCQAYGKLMATPFGEELNDQQSPLWRDIPALRPKLAEHGLTICDDEYTIVLIEPRGKVVCIRSQGGM